MVFRALEYLQTGRYCKQYGYIDPQETEWKFPLPEIPEKDVLTLEELKELLHQTGVTWIDTIPLLAIAIANTEVMVDQAIKAASGSNGFSSKDLLVKLEKSYSTNEFDKIGFEEIRTNK